MKIKHFTTTSTLNKFYFTADGIGTTELQCQNSPTNNTAG